MPKSYFFLSVLFLNAFAFFAQIIVKGKAIESDSGEPVYSSCAVFLLQQKDKQVVSVSSLNFDGEYRINTHKSVKGPLLIYAHLPGYKPFRSDTFPFESDKIRFVDIAFENDTTPSISVFHNTKTFLRYGDENSFCSTTLSTKLMKAFNDSIKLQIKIMRGVDRPMPPEPGECLCSNASPKEGWHNWMNKIVDQLDSKTKKAVLKEKHFVIKFGVGNQKPYVIIREFKNKKALSKLKYLFNANIADIIPGNYCYSGHPKIRQEVIVEAVLVDL